MRRTFWLPLYEQKVIVIVSDDPPNVAAKKHRLAVPFPRAFAKAECQGVTWDDPDATIVYLPPKASINTVCHEAMHVAICIADKAGLEWEIEETNEHIAYLVGQVAEELWKITRVARSKIK